MAKSIGIHFFEFEDMSICYRDNENLKKHFGHMDTLTGLELEETGLRAGAGFFTLISRNLHQRCITFYNNNSNININNKENGKRAMEVHWYITVNNPRQGIISYG